MGLIIGLFTFSITVLIISYLVEQENSSKREAKYKQAQGRYEDCVSEFNGYLAELRAYGEDTEEGEGIIS